MQYDQWPQREWISWLLDLAWRLVPSIQEEGAASPTFIPLGPSASPEPPRAGGSHGARLILGLQDPSSSGQRVPRLQMVPPGPGSASSRAAAWRLLSSKVRNCASSKPCAVKLPQSKVHLLLKPRSTRGFQGLSSPFLPAQELPQRLHICTGTRAEGHVCMVAARAEVGVREAAPERS